MTSPRAPHATAGAGRAGHLRSAVLDGLGVVDAVVTTRHGGISSHPYDTLNLGLHVGDDPGAVIENRARAAATVGLDLDHLVFCAQTHSTEVAPVRARDRGRGVRHRDDAIADTDALVTTDPDVGLVVMVADCVPMVLVDPDARVLACVHAGWRGTAGRIGSGTVRSMTALGAEPDRIVAWIGPSIAPTRYQVGDEVAHAVVEAFGDAAPDLVQPDGTGRWHLDLWATNRLDLESAGVPAARIDVAAIDTASDLFFSDRSHRPCGRFAAIARLRP